VRLECPGNRRRLDPLRDRAWPEPEIGGLRKAPLCVSPRRAVPRPIDSELIQIIKQCRDPLAAYDLLKNLYCRSGSANLPISPRYACLRSNLLTLGGYLPTILHRGVGRFAQGYQISLCTPLTRRQAVSSPRFFHHLPRKSLESLSCLRCRLPTVPAT
jgi:hypothetical protein